MKSLGRRETRGSVADKCLESAGVSALNRAMKETLTSHGRMVRIVGAAVLAGVVLAAHFYTPAQASALANEAIRSLHGPGFGLVALLVLKLLRFSGGPLAVYFKAGAATMLLAVLAEAAQIPGPREAEMRDLLVDALGIAGFLGCAAAFDRDVIQSIGRVRAGGIALIGVPALAAAVFPTAWLSYALVMRSNAVPQLLSFDAAWESTYAFGDEIDFEIIPAPGGWPAGSGKIARLHSAGKYGLMLHLHAYPDWSDYAGVSFIAATTGGETRRIALGLWGLRPRDKSPAGRFYTRTKITPEPARYCISFSDLPDESTERSVDLRRISELLVGAARNELGVTVYVDDFRLERSTEDCSLK